MALQSEHSKLSAEHTAFEPRSRISTSAVSSTTTPGSDISFAESIFPSITMEHTSALGQISQASLPGELALELILQDIIIS